METNENFWEAILSRDKKIIIQVFSMLNESEKFQVIDHLNRMSHEDGWHPEQAKSAKITLNILQS